MNPGEHFVAVPARKSAAGPIIVIVVLTGLVYAALCCHVSEAVPWSDFGLYSLNKGIALGAVFLLTCSFSFGPLVRLGIRLPPEWLAARKAIGMTGFLLVLIHTLTSLVMLNTAAYEEYFEPNGTLTRLTGFSMLFGVMALVGLMASNLSFHTYLREDRRFDRLITSENFLRISLLLGAAHLLMLGYEDWLRPGDWAGGMPPVSLLAFVVLSLSLFINLLGDSKFQ